MYKLFLTLRYLTRKKIVVFPILVVWLCVMMLIIVTSIMGGFVDRVRDANRDLYGDIIISAGTSTQGFEGYDQLAKDLKAQFPEIKASTPVVEAVAILYVPTAQRSVPALLVGVRPEERSQVSQFRESLFQQYKAPEKAAELLSPRLPASKDDLVKFAQDNFDNARKKDDAARTTIEDLQKKLFARHGIGAGFSAIPAEPNWINTLWLVLVILVVAALVFRARHRRITTGISAAGAYLFASGVGLVGILLVAAGVLWPVIFPRQFELAEDHIHQTAMELDEAARTVDYANRLPAGTYKTVDDLLQAILPPKPSFDLPPAAKVIQDGQPPLPKEGVIVGSQIGFFRRDTRGNFVHHYPDDYRKISITVFPPSKNGRINIQATNAITQDFTIVDDSHTGVYDVDSLNVYASFETVQLMAGMRPDPQLGPAGDFPARCHQILIRLTPAGQAHMKEVRAQIDDFVQHARPAGDLDVQTWDEKQARYLGAVENEKTMMTFILLLMSVVVLVVIFLIFYQIVRDKTRDIGIIKAVGGSELGVATIFLSYGLMIGIVGGGLGVLSGCVFVTHTNQIHEWIYQSTGMIIWDRSVYLFDRIPDVVHYSDVVLYFSVALAAGILGALIPAVLAALEDPVKAVRYE